MKVRYSVYGFHIISYPQLGLLVLLFSLAHGDWSCDECRKVMKMIEMSSTSEEGIAEQVDILLAQVCPQVGNVEECVEELPAFWGKLAPVLWSYAFEPSPWCKEICPALVKINNKLGLSCAKLS